MSTHQTNQVDPGDCATDSTSTIQDGSRENAHAFGVTGETALAPPPNSDVHGQPTNNGDGFFSEQTAEEQNLEVDVRFSTRWQGEHVEVHGQKWLTS
jgi:hypothetical protein